MSDFQPILSYNNDRPIIMFLQYIIKVQNSWKYVEKLQLLLNTNDLLPSWPLNKHLVCTVSSSLHIILSWVMKTSIILNWNSVSSKKGPQNSCLSQTIWPLQTSFPKFSNFSVSEFLIYLTTSNRMLIFFNNWFQNMTSFVW